MSEDIGSTIYDHLRSNDNKLSEEESIGRDPTYKPYKHYIKRGKPYTDDLREFLDKYPYPILANRYEYEYDVKEYRYSICNLHILPLNKKGDSVEKYHIKWSIDCIENGNIFNHLSSESQRKALLC